MYSTSRWTLVLVLVALMTCFEMYFMATSWPVMVWTASVEVEGERGEVAGSTDCLLFTFPKVPSAISWMTVYSPSLDGG